MNNESFDTSLSVINCSKRYEQVREICNKIADTYEKKNKDYGNSFDELMDEIKAKGISPEVVFYIRAKDKLNRIMSLSKMVANVKDESKLDTVMDLATYSVMFARYLQEKRSVSNE